MTSPALLPIEQLSIQTNGITLNVLASGPNDGQVVIFLHGFPEMGLSWRKYLTHFAKAGYRAYAPDQRGYNDSDKPEEVNSYRLDNLAKDIIGMMDALHVKQCYLVGHDWGGIISFILVNQYPERFKKLVVMNIPLPQILVKSIRPNPVQVVKSLYAVLFQIPVLPETIMRSGYFSLILNSLINNSKNGTFSQADLDTYKAAWAKPRALTGMLNWYRSFRHLLLDKKPIKLTSISTPTLMFWGSKDPFLAKSMAQTSIALCEQGKLVFFDDAGHWVQHEKFEPICEAIEAFFKADR